MGQKRSAKNKTPAPAAISQFQEALKRGDDWFTALLESISLWEMPEEKVKGRHYRYLISGEAFDWLLLAERLCESVNGAIPEDAKESLLFFDRPPHTLEDEGFKQAIGSAKHRAHLNFLYGVIVEEALQLIVEQEVLKEWHARGRETNTSVEHEVFERIYGKNCDELLATWREEHSLPQSEEISYGEMREFTYWLFKYRVNQLDPARVASDTRRALAQISQLETAAQRRFARGITPDVDEHAVVDGEVLAHIG